VGLVLKTLLLSLVLGPSVWAQEITVSAASSLTESFKEIGALFEKEHPGSRVLFNFGASDKLLQQILAGAPVDVFAAADQVAMDKAISQRAIQAESRAMIASNALVLIVPSDSKARPSHLKDLLDPLYRHIALGNPTSVPVGRYTQEALVRSELWQPLEARFVFAQSVRQALDYVARGEAEAGFVYATDAMAMSGKVHVAMRVPTSTPITYPAAVVASTRQQTLASLFVRCLVGPQGQSILARHGFGKP
jgi:molybdate transport system substrate-binding protein